MEKKTEQPKEHVKEKHKGQRPHVKEKSNGHKPHDKKHVKVSPKEVVMEPSQDLIKVQPASHVPEPHIAVVKAQNKAHVSVPPKEPAASAITIKISDKEVKLPENSTAELKKIAAALKEFTVATTIKFDVSEKTAKNGQPTLEFDLGNGKPVIIRDNPENLGRINKTIVAIAQSYKDKVNEKGFKDQPLDNIAEHAFIDLKFGLHQVSELSNHSTPAKKPASRAPELRK